MIRGRRILLLAFLAGDGWSCSPETPSPIGESAPELPLVLATSAKMIVVQPSASATACAPALAVDSSRLAATWPGLVGRRVTFSARVERAVGFTEFVAVAKGARFIVLAGPQSAWTGTEIHTFVVSGSATVALRGGRVTLPELVLTDGDCT